MEDIGDTMQLGEAHRLILILLNDTSSQAAASVREWTHPLDRTDMTLRDLYDLQYAKVSKKRPDAYPRPWHKPKHTTVGAGGMAVSEYERIKAASQN